MQKRLPKSARVAGAVQGKRITDRSLEIITAIARYRFLRTRSIVRLVGGNEDVTHRHLQQLFHRDLVSRFTLPAPKTGEFIYFLDNTAALRPLVASGMLGNTSLDWESIKANREKYRETGTHSVGRFLFIEHELMISDFHADLEMAIRDESSAKLDRWEQGSVIWNTVQLTKKEALPHRPDALFIMSFPNAPEGQQRSNFVYEADRETSNLTRIRQKLEAHLAFFTQGRQIERYGFRKLRAVLFETLTNSRSEQIKELAAALAAKEPLAGLMFWFSSTENCMSPLSRRWTCAADSRPRSLLD
jgi:hypothetical protein